MKRDSIAFSETPLETSPDKSRTLRLAVFGVMALAVVWRVAILLAMPTLARDGVGYCWNARALGAEGVAALQRPEFNQHPLYSLSILGVAAVLRVGGFGESPLLWQAAGQLVSLVCGVGVVLLCGVLTRRIARSADATADGGWAAVWAMLLAALLPLNVWLSVDVMSEQLFLCAYLAAACLLTNVTSPRMALGFGLLVGSAFLTRPEGAGLGVAGIVAIAAGMRREELKRVAIAGLSMAIGFAVVATPYWIALGRFSPKSEKQTVDEFVPAAVMMAAPVPKYAALIYERRAWYEAAPLAAYETVRGGRVVVPLLALGSLVAWRRRLLAPPLMGYTTAAAVHFSLTVMLLNRHGYLDPRHTLVVVLLLVPPAAIFLERVVRELRTRITPIAAALALMVATVPLAAYSLRVPHGKDEYVRDAARWIQRQPGAGRESILVGGSSQRRIAFYADVGFRAWEENAGTTDEKLASLVDHLWERRPAARFFAIETDLAAGPGHERHGNLPLFERLLADSRVGERIRAFHTIPIGGSAEMRLIELDD